MYGGLGADDLSYRPRLADYVYSKLETGQRYPALGEGDLACDCNTAVYK